MPVTYLCIEDFLPLWGQVVLDAVDSSIEGDTTDEQDGENHIGERGREIHHLDGNQDKQRIEFLYSASLAFHMKPAGLSD